MASDDYIPRSDGDFQMWAESLVRCIKGDPEKYRFTQQEAEDLAVAVRNFSDAYLKAINPWTRTRWMVAAKKEAREICEQMCRQRAMSIKHNALLSDSDKIDAGVRPIERRAQARRPLLLQPRSPARSNPRTSTPTSSPL